MSWWCCHFNFVASILFFCSPFFLHISQKPYKLENGPIFLKEECFFLHRDIVESCSYHNIVFVLFMIVLYAIHLRRGLKRFCFRECATFSICAFTRINSCNRNFSTNLLKSSSSSQLDTYNTVNEWMDEWIGVKW